MFREYKTLTALRHGEVVNLEGLLLKQDSGQINVGDLYIAERNTGPHLLTAARIDERGWICPTTEDYCFDVFECVKVCEA